MDGGIVWEKDSLSRGSVKISQHCVCGMEMGSSRLSDELTELVDGICDVWTNDG